MGELGQVGAVERQLDVGRTPEPQIAQCSELGEREDFVHQRTLSTQQPGDRGEDSQVLGVVGAQGPAGGWCGVGEGQLRWSVVAAGMRGVTLLTSLPAT